MFISLEDCAHSSSARLTCVADGSIRADERPGNYGRDGFVERSSARRIRVRSPLGAPASNRAGRSRTLAFSMLAVLVAGFVAAQAKAATVRWTGAAGDRRWETAGNWTVLNGAGVPTGAPAAAPGLVGDGGPHDVIIPGGSGRVVIGVAGNKALRSFSIPTGGTKVTLTNNRDATGTGISIDISATAGFFIGVGHEVAAEPSTAGGGVGRNGADIRFTSSAGAIDLAASSKLKAGNGGGTGAQPAGRGGDIVLRASTLVRCFRADVLAGDSGTGSGVRASPARGGNVTIAVSAGNLINAGRSPAKGIQAGAGRARGGSVVITATSIINNLSFATIFGGPGTVAGAPGGNVLLIATAMVQNTGDTLSGEAQPAMIRAGNGGKAGGGGDSGRGGWVTVIAPIVLNGRSPTGQVRPSDILGGTAGIGNTPNPVSGGTVSVFGALTVHGGTMLGGKGRTADDAGAPKGNLSVVTPVLWGVKKFDGRVVRLAVLLQLGAQSDGTPMIDLSGLSAGAISADDLVCINAGDGTIKLTDSASGAIVCGGGSGPVVLNAALVELPGVPQPVPPESYVNLLQQLIAGDVQFAWSCSESCDGDLDGDGIVGESDLEMLLAAWESEIDFFDLDDDGELDGADVGVLLGNWGVCSID